MKEVLLDSSSAILLYKAGIIELCYSCYKLFSSQSVYNELVMPKKSGSVKFKELYRNHFISIIEVNKSSVPKIPLKGGEHDIIVLKLSGRGDFIIIDDREGARFCQKNSLPFINSLLVLKIFYFSEKIDEINYHKSMSKLLAIGRYAKWVRDYVRDCTEKELFNFFP